MTTPPIAVQLYSVRDALAADFEGVLRRIADMGYVGVEMAGNYGPGGPAEGAAFIRSLGMEITSAHLGLPDAGDATEQIATAKALGTANWVVPWIPPEKWATPEAVLEQIGLLNQAAKLANEAGLNLFYHNHWFEFESTPGLGGGTPFELMMEHLDPAVLWEVDLYWVKTGGSDPAATLARLGERAALLHLKDGPTTLQDAMLALGEGVMNYPSFLSGSTAKWLIVELDRCDTDVVEAVGRSYTYLTEQGLAHGRA
ncbi:MAG: sugar phosphate isomerase/epimerase [Anaerolineae bacterium]